MRDRWKIKALRQLCQLVSGQHIDAKNYNTERKGVGYLTGPSDFGPISPVVSKWTEFPKVKAHAGDTLITVKGSGVGSINLLDRNDIAISRQLMAVRATGADASFIHLFLASKFEYFQSLATGAAIPGLSRDQVLGLELQLPPLSEQKRIVAILDEAFAGINAAITNAEKNIEYARELFNGYLDSVFTQRGEGWVEKRLGDIVKTQYGLSEKMNEGKLGYKIFRMGEVQNGRLIDTDKMKYADISPSEFSKYKLHSGDVLFNRTNSYELVGKTGIFSLKGDYCFASYLVRLEADRSKVAPEFLNYFMNSSVFQDSIKQKASRSINQANINATILSNEKMPLPRTIAGQVAIVRKLDNLSFETRRLQGVYRQKLDALAELKQAILQQAFAGELTARPEKALQEVAA